MRAARSVLYTFLSERSPMTGTIRFHEPLEALVVLGRTAGDGEPVRMAAPAGEGLEDLGDGPSRVIVDKTAPGHRPEPVDHVDLVPGTVPQHAHAVPRFIGIQTAQAAVGLV